MLLSPAHVYYPAHVCYTDLSVLVTDVATPNLSVTLVLVFWLLILLMLPLQPFFF